ncbi:S-layer homology domain-containing protein [Pelotomaculum propionicicum]|uniref:S-layer homology domain-containing protein n=1 Tax=Pelotomaculum propionicicum TaxID=258475 RepID=UPI003B78565C
MKEKNKILIAIGLAALVILMFTGQSLAAPPDIQNHWAQKQISDWVDKGYISGYPDGSFKPDNTITRAEFVTMANRAFGKNATVPVSFPDVSSKDWFAAGVAKAVAAGYISGYDDGTFRPNENIKRQEAAVMITKLLNLAVSADDQVLNQFADYADIPQWSKGYIGAVVAAGYMSGYTDQTYQPEGHITRAEAVSTLDRALMASVETVTYDSMGTYGPADGVKTIDGSVNISVSGVTLQNIVITGNLFLAESIGDGDVTLKNVIVQGNTVIKGGGNRSVTLENCSLPNITVGKNGVRIVASGNTSVSIVRLESGATLVEVSLSGPGFETVTVTELAPADAEITLDGNFANVNVSAEAARIKITGGTVTNMEIAETAPGAVIDIAAGAKVSTMTLDAAVSVTGQGTIETAKINVSGSTFEQEPINVVKAEDVDVTTGTGGGGTPTGTITISNIDSTNTLGKFKFDTDTVTTIDALEGKIMADGDDAINIAKRNNGEDGKVWNAFIATTPYEYDIEYEITCEYPFIISGNNTVMWSGSSSAPAATNVTADDVDNNGDGSDLEVSFDGPRGQNTRIESYRVLVVKSAGASSFTLSDANGVTDFTTVDKIEDAPSYTVVLDADAKDVDGDPITEDVSYKVFVLSVADGVNATENALSAASASITLSSGGGGGGGGGGTGDLSDAGAALAVAGSKTAGAAFDLSISGAKDTDGVNLEGNVAVTVTSDLDGEVYSGSAAFTGGAATVTIAAGEVMTAGTNTLTVAIAGVTPQPEVEVTVVAASNISAANSTAQISPALAEGATSTITVTLRDQYNNPMVSTTKNLKIAVTITAADGTTTESYTVDGDVLTSTPALPLDRAGEATDADGKVYFDVTVPATVDAGDGITVQVTQNNGTAIGSTFSYSGSGGGGDLSEASAELAVAGSKTAGAAFDLSITGAKDTGGVNLEGNVTVTVTSDLDGEVYSGSAAFTGGAATVTIAAGQVTTAGTNTLTVSIAGVTPQPEVGVTVVALSNISSANSTAQISPALGEGTTSTITVTLRDQYNNPMASTTKNLKIAVTITAADGTTTESYTVDGDVLTSTPALPLDRAGEATDADGKVYFDVTVPATVDAGDGITVQVTQNNGTAIGSTFSYSGSGGGGDLSEASAELAVAGSKTAGAAFDLSITGAKDTGGVNLEGNVTVTVTSDLDGEVYSGSAAFTGGAATVTIAAGQVTTAGTNTLTVSIAGVTPQPEVGVTVVALSNISAANSTAEISPALAEGTTSTITVTLRDQYNNLMTNISKNMKIEVTVTNSDATTAESYTVDGSTVTVTETLTRGGTTTDADGKYYFDVALPAAIDAGDGISVQVTQNDQAKKIGSPFSFTAP